MTMTGKSHIERLEGMWRVIWKWFPAAAIACGLLTLGSWFQSVHRMGQIMRAITQRDGVTAIADVDRPLNRLSRATGIRGSLENLRIDPVVPLESVDSREALAQHVNALLTKNNPELSDTDQQRILDLAERLDPGNGFYKYAVACIRLTDLSQQVRFREQAQQLPPELRQDRSADRETLRRRQRLFWAQQASARMSPRQRAERDRCMRMLAEAASAPYFRSYRWEPLTRLAQAVNTGSVYHDTLAFRLATYGWDYILIHRPPFSLAEWYVAWWSELPRSARDRAASHLIVQLNARRIQDAATTWDVRLAYDEARSAQRLLALAAGEPNTPALPGSKHVSADALRTAMVAGPVGGLTEFPNWSYTPAITKEQRRQSQWMENLELESYALIMLMCWLFVRTCVWFPGLMTRSLPRCRLPQQQRIRVSVLCTGLVCLYLVATRAPGLGVLRRTPLDPMIFHTVQTITDAVVWLTPALALVLTFGLRWVFPIRPGFCWELKYRWLSWFGTALLAVVESTMAAVLVFMGAWGVADGLVSPAALNMAALVAVSSTSTHYYRLVSAKRRGESVRPLTAYLSTPVWAMLLCLGVAGFWLNRWQHQQAVQADTLLISQAATRTFVSPAESQVVQAMRTEVLRQWPFTDGDTGSTIR